VRSHCLPPPCQCSSAACKSACALVRWSPVTTLEVLVCLHVSCVCGIGWVHVRCLRGARASALSEYLTSARRMARYKEIGAVSNVASLNKGCLKSYFYEHVCRARALFVGGWRFYTRRATRRSTATTSAARCAKLPSIRLPFRAAARSRDARIFRLCHRHHWQKISQCTCDESNAAAVRLTTVRRRPKLCERSQP